MALRRLLTSMKVPVIAAPMAGGPSTPQLAAAVANAGGIGGLGFAYSTPQKIADDLAAVAGLTTKSDAILANFFVLEEPQLPDANTQQAALDALRSLPIANDVRLAMPEPPFIPSLAAQLQAVWDSPHRPAIVTFHFGIPPAEHIARAKECGMLIGMTATSADEAQRVAAAGADFIVAQGFEAGGHNGIFDRTAERDTLPLDKLLPEVLKVCLPVVAAGGIMDGAAIRRVIQAGAVAAQMGTAFLACPESGASPAYKRYLLTCRDAGTVVTRAFSGRRARAVNNEFTTRMHAKSTLPFPIQNTVTQPIRAKAQKLNEAAYQSLYAGVNYSACRQLSAGELVHALQREYNETARV